MSLSKDVSENIASLSKKLNCDKSFDIIKRDITINNRKSAFFFVDGLIKDEVMEKILEFFYSIDNEDFFKDVASFSHNCIPYVEVSTLTDEDKIVTEVLSGVTALFIDGIDAAFMLDLRTYPQRDTAEPEKDKVLRGSKDAFVETVIFNTALIRRRIRSEKLIMSATKVGKISKTDVVLCYMEDKVDKKLLATLQKRLDGLDLDVLTMNTETLCEALYKRKWFNPFPKVKYTERPDSAAHSVYKGNIVILVDNAPEAIVLPTSIFDIMEEADDFYFPPITGTYLRFTRYIVSLLTVFVTPLWMLSLAHPENVPQMLRFIIPTGENIGLPIFWQMIILEIIIDGLRLASLNTPDALSTSLSVIAAIALSEFAVDTGWFTKETMLYMAFVAIANYTQPNYELGYCLKFARVFLLIMTVVFDLWGLIAGTVIVFILLLTNKTISGKSYLYPLVPFNGKALFAKLFRSTRIE